MKRKLIVLMLGCLLAITGTACGGDKNSAADSSAAASYETAGYDAGYATEGAADYDMADEAAGVSEAAGGNVSATDISQPADGRKIIRDTTLVVETKRYDDSLVLLKRAVEEADGYIEYSSQYAGGSTRNANFTCRIPAAQYTAFLESVQGAGSVVRIEESTEDATNQYIDLEARLKSLRAQETRLLELMENSGSLEELLAVQEKLSDVQYQIDSYTGQMKALENRIDYTTVTVCLDEVETYTPIEPSFGERAGQAFQNMLRGIADGAQGFVIVLIYALPLIVIAAVALVIVLIAVKRKKRRMPAVPPVPPVPPQNKP